MARLIAKRIHFWDDGGVHIMELDFYVTTRSQKNIFVMTWWFHLHSRLLSNIDALHNVKKRVNMIGRERQ